MASFKKLKSGWQYRVSYKDGDKYRTKNGNGFSTKKEAQIAAQRVEEMLFLGNDINANPPFVEYMQFWYETFKKDKYSAKNNKDIEHSINVAKKYFKETLIKDIDRTKYQKFINWYANNRATATVKKVHIYCRECLRDALSERIIHTDPTYKIIVKGTVPKKDENVKYLSYQETIDLIKELKTNLNPKWKSRYIILIALSTGLRFSEVLALEWEDIDFKNKTIRVNKSYDHVLSKEIISTKTKSSIRTITVDENTLKEIKSYKVANYLNHPKFLFIDRLGETVSNNAVNKSLKRACKRAGVKEITFHSLRHTHCSLLIYKGVNIKYISKRLGHSDISTTYGTYGHIIDEMEQIENTKLNDIMKEILH